MSSPQTKDIIEEISNRTINYTKGGATLDTKLVQTLAASLVRDPTIPAPCRAAALRNVYDMSLAHAALRNNKNFSVPPGVITLGLVGTIVAPVVMAPHFADLAYSPYGPGHISGYISHLVISFALFELSFANMNIHRLVLLDSLVGTTRDQSI